MKKSQLHHSLISIVATATCLNLALLSGCGNERLGANYVPPERTEDESDLGPASPLATGTMWFNIQASYKRTSESDSSGATQHEVQSSGHLCVSVDTIKDTATEEFNEEAETKVIGRVKVTGAAGAQDLDFSDQDNAATTGAEVDAYLNALWLKQLTVASSSHGFTSPTETVFATRTAPVPPNLNLVNFPFFEVRELTSTNTVSPWSGWVSLGGEFEGADNYTNAVIAYFMGEYGAAFVSDKKQFRIKVIDPPTDCADFADAGACNMNNCTWGSRSQGTRSECMSIYKVSMTWRDRIDTPAEQAGDTLHFIEYNYYDDGTLHYAREDVRPADESSVPSTEDLPSELPHCSVRCLTADIAHYGAVDSNPSYPAPCTF